MVDEVLPVVSTILENDIEIIKEAELPYARVELRSDDILAFRPDIKVFSNYTIPILEEMLEVFKEITEGQPKPYFCDNRYITGIVNKEEKEFINKHFGEFALCTAMVSDSTILKVILNSYNAIYKPDIEIRIFSSEDPAINWLRQRNIDVEPK